MPYRGGSGKDLLQGFLAGQENRRAWIAQRQAQEAQSAQEALQQEYLTLAKQREVRQGERDVRQDALAQAQESRLGMLSKMKGMEFEQGQMDRSKAMRSESQLDEAMTGTSVGNVYRMLKEYPELVPHAQGASAMASKITDPKAKALFAQSFVQSLDQKAQEIDLDRAEQRFNNALARGAFHSSDRQIDEKAMAALQLARDGINLHRESGGKLGLSGKQAVDTAFNVVLESAENDAIATAIRMDAEELRATYGSQLKGQARAQFFKAVGSYERLAEDSGYDVEKLNQLGMELSNPMQGKQDPREKARADLITKLLSDPMGDIEGIPARLKAFDEMMGTGPSGPAVGGGSKPPTEEQVAWGQANEARLVGKSPQEIDALWKAHQAGGAGSERLAPPMFKGAAPARGRAQQAEAAPPRSRLKLDGPAKPPYVLPGKTPAQMEEIRGKIAREDAERAERTSQEEKAALESKAEGERYSKELKAFTAAANDFFRDMTREESAEFGTLRKSGDKAQRDAFIAKLKAKYGR
jgi:hypothetical protein